MNALFLSEANKLKNAQFYLEKNCTLLERISKYEDDLGLVKYHEELEKNRKHENNLISGELKSIWKQLQAKKILLQENVAELDLHSFKKCMVEVQDKLYTLRMKLISTSETLENQEKTLRETTEIYNKKLEEWGKPLKISPSRNHTSGPQNTTNNHNEVAVFMNFVNKSNGHENGWSSENHLLFLKLRHKYTNINDLVVNLNKLLPDISVEDVEQHEEWYKKYLLLKTRKKEALRNWREGKSKISSQSKVEEPKPEPEVKLKPRDENIREQIAMWKAEKEAQKGRIRMQELIRAERMRLIEEDQRRLKCQVKKEVAKWKEEKVMQEKIQKMRKELEECHIKRVRAATANKMIKQFQSQDDLFMAKIRSKKLKERNKTKSRSKSSYMVERDFDRLLKPTKQWILRTKKDDFPTEPSLFVPNIKEVPRLKVPDWRKDS